jgi:hypothetical protein
MFFASWAATLGQAFEPTGSIPFAAGGRVAPAEAHSATDVSVAAIRRKALIRLEVRG